MCFLFLKIENKTPLLVWVFCFSFEKKKKKKKTLARVVFPCHCFEGEVFTAMSFLAHACLHLQTPL